MKTYIKNIPKVTSMSENQPKQRGRLLTLWLLLLILANILSAFFYIFTAYVLATTSSSAINDATNPLFNFALPFWAISLFPIFSIVNVYAAIALLKWRKWGFFALCVSYLIETAANLVLGNILAIVGLLGIAILYLLLRSKWSRLR
jgi:hypothetical protein